VSMYPLARKLLFRLEPEQAHALTLRLVAIAGGLPPVEVLLRRWFKTPNKPRKVFGLTFKNPVGLAAGYDKDGIAWRGLACLGFGHIEVGTVTPEPQDGNPGPRLFRLPEYHALINRLGFPGRGGKFVSQQLAGKRPPGLVLGINLGKNKDTPLEAAAQDYLKLLPVFAPLADYLAINVSSPNTVGLRRLQARQALDELLLAVMDEGRQRAQQLGRPVPVLVKLAPDLSDEELDDALQVLLDRQVDGVIATNTTIQRPGLSHPLAGQAGGLSGAPLEAISTAQVEKIHRRTGGMLPIVGVGGIMSPEDAQRKLDAGAALVQVYTGMVYAGPGLVRRIVQDIRL
jgi:dihydroorotate dehydrogenase